MINKAANDCQPREIDLKHIFSNPLHWFGVLVPTALRDAQRSFVSVVDGPILALANVITELREIEAKVDYLRQMLPVVDKTSVPGSL